jgi:CheY-like chemotaxis protein
MNTLSPNILIADDDKDDIAFLTEAIEAALPSANIVAVTDGIAALRDIKTSVAADIVFLDLNMPLKNGLEVLKDIYNHELLPNTPIVIYSTSNKLKDIDDAYNYNAAFYIIKPASFKELSRIIKAVVTFLLDGQKERVGKTDFVLSETKLKISELDK